MPARLKPAKAKVAKPKAVKPKSAKPKAKRVSLAKSKIAKPKVSKPTAGQTKVSAAKPRSGMLLKPLKRSDAVPEVSSPAKRFAILLAEAAYDKKAIDVVVLDVVGISPITEYMVICSARSSPHLGAIADAVAEAARKVGQGVTRREGGKRSDPSWTLLDFFDVMVHVLTTENRAHYSLETLYTGAKKVIEFQ